MSLFSLPWKVPVSLASVLFRMGFWATVWLLRSFPRRFLCFRCLACLLICRYFLSSFSFDLVFVLLRLLRDSVESQFLRDGVLPLGRVCSVSCGFSVCAVFAVFISLSLILFLGWLLRLWFQALLGLLMTVLGFLPSHMALLCLPHSHPFLRPHPVLCLSGYRLTSDPPATAVSLHRCLDALPALGSPTPERTIGPRGLAIGLGVLGMVSLWLVPLFEVVFFPVVLDPFSPFFPGGFSHVLSSGSSLAPWASCSLNSSPVAHLSALSGALSQRRGSSGSLVSGVLLLCCAVLVFLAYISGSVWAFRSFSSSLFFFSPSRRVFVGSLPVALLL